MGISKDGLGRHRIEGVGDYLYKYKHVTTVDADVGSTFEWFEHEGSFHPHSTVGGPWCGRCPRAYT